MAELTEAAEKEPILFACSSCNRTFLPEVLAKHTKVCEKTIKKRKTFDSSKQRLQGTELEVYANLTPIKNKKKDDTFKTKTSPSKWKEKQADLVKTMQAAKKTINTQSVAITAKPSDHQKCPFCERFFGPKAYGRHVEWCKGQQLKFKNTNINIEARERLQVRTGYRAPLPNKVLTRDKYQPGGRRSRDPSLSKADSTKPKINEPVNRSQTFSISKSPVRGQTAERSKIIQTPNINLKSPMTMRKINVETDSTSTPLKTVDSPKIRSNSSSEKRKKQRMKLKLNDTSINNQLPGLKVSPYVPDVRLDTLSMSNTGNKGRTIINQTNNIFKKDNKIIYRLPTPSDILRSKNVNVPKVKRIDRHFVRNNKRVTETETNKDKIINSKNETNPTERTYIANEPETYKLIESITSTSPYETSDNIDNEINVAWAKFKDDESWHDRMKEMIAKQITLDCSTSVVHKDENLSDGYIDDEHSEEILDMKLVEDISSMETTSFLSDRYETDQSNDLVYMDSFVELIKEPNDSDVSLENCAKIESHIDDYEMDKPSNETFTGNHFEKSNSIDLISTVNDTKTESPFVINSSPNYSCFTTDYSLQGVVTEENSVENNSDMYLILKSPTSNCVSENIFSNHPSCRTLILDEKSDESDVDFQSNLKNTGFEHKYLDKDAAFNSRNIERVDCITDSLLGSAAEIKLHHFLEEDCTAEEEYYNKLKAEIYDKSYVTHSNNSWPNNAAKYTSRPSESMQTNLWDIIEEVEEVYENMKIHNSNKFHPWAFLDNINVDDGYTIITYDFQEKNTFNKIIELPDSEDETQIETSNCTIEIVDDDSLSVVHEAELDQYKIIYPGNSAVYTIFGCSNSFLICFPLLLTMNISLHEMSTIFNFSRRSSRSKNIKPKAGNKFSLLPFRKFSQQYSADILQSNVDLIDKSLEGNLAEFKLPEKLIDEESRRSQAKNLESFLEQQALHPIINSQVDVNLQPVGTVNEDGNSSTATRLHELIVNHDYSDFKNIDFDTYEYFFEPKDDDLEKTYGKNTNHFRKKYREDHSSADGNRDYASDISSDEFNWDDKESSKYFASCSSGAHSDVDFHSEKSFSHYRHNTYYPNQDNFIVHKKKIEYYETIEYKKDSIDYQTIKTSCVKLPLVNNQYNSSNKEFKKNWNFPSYTSKWIENKTTSNGDRLQKKYYRTSKPKSLVKLPPLVSKIAKQSTRDIDRYDPFASAEQQMMELFSSDSQRGATNENNQKNDTLSNNNNDGDRSTEQITSDPQKSPTTPIKSPPPVSAFAVYTRKPTPTDNLLTSSDDNKVASNNDNEIVVDNNNLDMVTRSSPIALINKPLDYLEKELLLNNLESCSVVSIDSMVDCNKNTPSSSSLAGGKYFRSNSDIVAPRHRTPGGDAIYKSNSAGSGRSSNKYKLNMQQMLFGDSPPPPTHANSNLSVTVDKPTDDINAATVGLLEECEAELMLELEKMLNAHSSATTTTITPPSPHLPSIQSSFAICSSDDQPETMDKLSGDKRSVGNTTIDSAYSSLTRVLSEGGGDTAKLEQSRFCHECGTQYPVAVAKFCCYCGMRRIAI